VIPLRFFGYSDDTFGEYARTRDDYDNCAANKSIDWAVTGPDGRGVLVSGRYGEHNACWAISVLPWGGEQGGLEVAMPPWPIRFELPKADETPYSPVLVIDAPADVTVRCLQRNGGVS
jgi:hypothetical protein